jgi:transposase
MTGVQLQVSAEVIQVIAEEAAEIVGDKRRFLSKEALAQHLGVSERRIKTLREHGLPARKIGRDLYFDLDEVNAWIDREGR